MSDTGFPQLLVPTTFAHPPETADRVSRGGYSQWQYQSF